MKKTVSLILFLAGLSSIMLFSSTVIAAECGEGKSCPSGQSCSSGSCVKNKSKEPLAECGGGKSCPPGQSCSSGSCVKKISTGAKKSNVKSKIEVIDGPKTPKLAGGNGGATGRP